MAGEAVFLGGCGLRGLAVVVKNGGCFGGAASGAKNFSTAVDKFLEKRDFFDGNVVRKSRFYEKK